MKKIGNILLDILIVIVVLLALAMSVMVISSKASGVPNVLGYSPVTVLTDSMEPTFKVGDLILIKQADIQNLKVGDVITYKEVINNVEILNTHRIMEVVVDENGFI
ncbi:MAG: signal peptidase I, partial [Eubacteriales bacterium]